MRKSPEPPPELADAIEDELDEDPEPIAQPPSKEELAKIPEWHAVNAWITAEEYLACFGYAPQPFTPVRHGLRGRPGSRLKRK